MSTVTRAKTWNTGDTLTAADLNAEFNNVLNSFNGGITNVNVASNAAIAYSKLNLAGSIINTDISTSAAIAYSKLNLGNSIVNADISSSAAIALSKISGTGMDLASNQTVTGQKTFTKPIFNGAIGTRTEVFDAATINFDMTSKGWYFCTIQGTGRNLTVSNISTNQTFVIELIQDGAGNRTVNWFSGIIWPNGTVPTLATSGNKRDVFCFRCIGSGSYLGFVAGPAMA